MRWMNGRGARSDRRYRSVVVVQTHAGDRRALGTRTGEAIFNREGFLQFWALYPRRVGRVAAIREWNLLKPDAALVSKMLDAVGWQQHTPGWREGFVPHPRTWLHQGRWEDEPFAPPTAAPSSKRIAGLAKGGAAFLRGGE